MEGNKLKGDTVNFKSNSETSKANESNSNDSIKALGDEFSPGDRSGLQTVETNSDTSKK